MHQVKHGIVVELVAILQERSREQVTRVKLTTVLQVTLDRLKGGFMLASLEIGLIVGNELGLETRSMYDILDKHVPPALIQLLLVLLTLPNQSLFHRQKLSYRGGFGYFICQH